MIFKKLKYIIISVVDTILRDLTSSYDKLSKPKEVLKALFWLIMIAIMTDQFDTAKILLFVYIAVYVWLIIKRAEWRKKLKESNFK